LSHFKAVGESLLVLRVTTATSGQQLIEGEASQWAQVAVPFEASEMPLLEFFFSALARRQSAKVWVPEGHIEAQPPPPLAERTFILFSFQDRLIS